MTTILVVDDNDVISYSIQNALPDCQVIHARNGLKALDILRQQTEIDLIVLDIQMPEMDGRGTCVKIRSINPMIPILPFTGYPDEAPLKMLRELGCLPPLIKPVEPEVLQKALREALKAAPLPVSPSSAVLAYTEELVSAKEQMVRARQALKVIIYAGSASVRNGVRALMDAAGASVAFVTPSQNNLRDELSSGASPAALVTVAADFPDIQALAYEHKLPVLCLSWSLADGLILAEATRQPTMPRIGIVVENRYDEADTQARITSTLRTLIQGTSVIPVELQQPFASLKALGAQEQEVLTLDVSGLSSGEIAKQLGIEPSTVRQHLMRIRQKLGLEKETLRAWAENWWMTQRKS